MADAVVLSGAGLMSIIVITEEKYTLQVSVPIMLLLVLEIAIDRVIIV